MKTKLSKLLIMPFLALAGLTFATSTFIHSKTHSEPEIKRAEATDFDGYYNVSIQGRTTSGGSWQTFSTTKSSTDPQIEYVNFACVSGFEFLGYYDKDMHGNWIKTFANNATGSTWDNNGADGNARCQTNGVYSLYFKPADGKTYIAYGTITVTLHYMNAATGAQIKTTTATTTSQNNYDVPSYDSISGYDRNGAVWKTTNSKSGTNYTATRLTTKTKDLYVFYSPAQTITRHALFFKDGTYKGTAQLANEYVAYGNTYPYDTSSSWPNGYDFQPAGGSKETYSFVGVYSSGNTSTGAYSGELTGSTTITANVTIYEVFTRLSTYTISYNRNNGGGSATASQNKTYGVSYSIANPTAFSWTPSDMKYFKYWNTKSDDSGTKYYVGDSYTTNAALGPLYYIEDYWDFQVKCGSGSYQSMSWNTGGGLPDGVKGQFGATMNVTAGQSLTFQVNKHDNNGWQTLSPAFSASDNNYADNAVLVDTTGASIWLKIKNDNSYDVYVSGYTPCAVVVGGVHHTTTKTGEGDSAVYDTEAVNVNKTQTVAVSWNHIVIDTYLNGDSTADCFSGSAGTVTCSLTGAYQIRVHNNGYGQHNTLYIQRDNSGTGKYLAQIFNTALSGVCEADGSTDKSDLTTAWNGAAAHFTSQPSAITTLFVIGSSDADIANMMNLYKYVIEKYGTTVASDFLGKGYKKSASRMILAVNSSDNLALLSFIAVAAVSMITVTGIVFYKKKKEQ